MLGFKSCNCWGVYMAIFFCLPILPSPLCQIMGSKFCSIVKSPFPNHQVQVAKVTLPNLPKAHFNLWPAQMSFKRPTNHPNGM
jgi:hypothetical protein